MLKLVLIFEFCIRMKLSSSNANFRGYLNVKQLLLCLKCFWLAALFLDFELHKTLCVCVLSRHSAESPMYKGSCVHTRQSKRSAFMYWSLRYKQVLLLSFTLSEMKLWHNVRYSSYKNVHFSWYGLNIMNHSTKSRFNSWDHHICKLKGPHSRQTGGITRCWMQDFTGIICATLPWLEQISRVCQAKLQIVQPSL